MNHYLIPQAQYAEMMRRQAQARYDVISAIVNVETPIATFWQCQVLRAQMTINALIVVACMQVTEARTDLVAIAPIDYWSAQSMTGTQYTSYRTAEYRLSKANRVLNALVADYGVIVCDHDLTVVSDNYLTWTDDDCDALRIPLEALYDSASWYHKILAKINAERKRLADNERCAGIMREMGVYLD